MFIKHFSQQAHFYALYITLQKAYFITLFIDSKNQKAIKH